jgi:hypothetical protein
MRPSSLTSRPGPASSSSEIPAGSGTPAPSPRESSPSSRHALLLPTRVLSGIPGAIQSWWRSLSCMIQEYSSDPACNPRNAVLNVEHRASNTEPGLNPTNPTHSTNSATAPAERCRLSPTQRTLRTQMSPQTRFASYPPVRLLGGLACPSFGRLSALRNRQAPAAHAVAPVASQIDLRTTTLPRWTRV